MATEGVLSLRDVDDVIAAMREVTRVGGVEAIRTGDLTVASATFGGVYLSRRATELLLERLATASSSGESARVPRAGDLVRGGGSTGVFRTVRHRRAEIVQVGGPIVAVLWEFWADGCDRTECCSYHCSDLTWDDGL